MGIQIQASLTHRRDSEEPGCFYRVMAEPSYLLSQGLGPTIVLHYPKHSGILTMYSVPGLAEQMNNEVPRCSALHAHSRLLPALMSPPNDPTPCFPVRKWRPRRRGKSARVQWLQSSRFLAVRSSMTCLLLGPGQPAREERDRAAHKHRSGYSRYFCPEHTVRCMSPGEVEGSDQGGLLLFIFVFQIRENQ